LHARVVSQQRRAWHRVRDGGLALLVVTFVMLALFVLLGSATDLFRIDIEQSGSMAPQIPVGAAVIVAHESASQVYLGQVIAYTPPAPYPNETVIHKVVKMQSVPGETIVVTRGIANQVNDPWKTGLSPRVWYVVGVVPGVVWTESILGNWVFQASVLVTVTCALVYLNSSRSSLHSRKRNYHRLLTYRSVRSSIAE